MKKSEYEASRIDGLLLAIATAIGVAQRAELEISDYVTVVSEVNTVTGGRQTLDPGYTTVLRTHDHHGNRITVDEFEARRSGFIHRFIALVALAEPRHPVVALVSGGHATLPKDN